MAAIPGFLHFYTSKDYCTISLVQILAAWTAVAVSNYASPSTSLMTRTAVSLRLFCMVFAVLCFTLIRIKSRIKLTTWQVVKLIMLVFGSAVVFHLIAILFGASVLEQSEETFCWALLMSHLVVLPACSLLGAQLELVPRIFFSAWSDATPEAYFQCTIVFTLIGAWLGAFPIPLDWDRPWQVRQEGDWIHSRTHHVFIKLIGWVFTMTQAGATYTAAVWPIPCAIGAILGYIIGIGISTVTYTMNEDRFRPR